MRGETKGGKERYKRRERERETRAGDKEGRGGAVLNEGKKKWGGKERYKRRERERETRAGDKEGRGHLNEAKKKE